jgi:hypothetical protein
MGRAECDPHRCAALGWHERRKSSHGAAQVRREATEDTFSVLQLALGVAPNASWSSRARLRRRNSAYLKWGMDVVRDLGKSADAFDSITFRTSDPRGSFFKKSRRGRLGRAVRSGRDHDG